VGGGFWQWLTSTLGALAGDRSGHGWDYASETAAGRPRAVAPAAAPMGGGQYGPASSPVSATGVPGDVRAEDWASFVQANASTAATYGLHSGRMDFR
jgi:hypothetical protein